MGLEFGILRTGSTVTLEGESRVLLDESVLQELLPLVARIEARTGQEIDVYGSASFSGSALAALVEELQLAKDFPSLSVPASQFLSQLLAVSLVAVKQSRAIAYFGL